MAPEAPLRQTKFGLAPDGEGWFVMSARDSRWRDTGRFGFYCDFEGKRRFRDFGINLNVLEPGQSLATYHRENGQEGFLVLAGSCLLIVEDEVRELKTWDFFHCPPRTTHVILAGEERAVVVAVGARGRRRKGIEYPDSQVARKHDVGGKQTWTSTRVACDESWLPNR